MKTVPAPPAIQLPPFIETGFLTASESSKVFKAHVYIAAMGRSGSTMLCDLMTIPGRTLCLMEPWFVEGCRSEVLLMQMLRAGLLIDKKCWWEGLASARHEDYLRRYMDLLAPQLDTLERWGAKEVRAEFHRPTIETINPEKILILVRDIRDVVYSLEFKLKKEGGTEDDNWNWICTYVECAVRELLSLLKDPALRSRVMVYQYEEFTQSVEARDALARQLDWPLEGLPNASFSALGRADEAGPLGTVRPATPWHKEYTDSRVRDRVSRLAEQHTAYQRTFGYI